MYRLLFMILGSFTLVATACSATGEELRIEARTRALEDDELVSFLFESADRSIGTPREEIVARELHPQALTLDELARRAEGAGWSHAAGLTWFRCHRLEYEHESGATADELPLQIDLVVEADDRVAVVQLLADGVWPAHLEPPECAAT